MHSHREDYAYRIFWDDPVFRQYEEAARQSRQRPMLHLVRNPMKVEGFKTSTAVRVTLWGGVMMKVGHRVAMRTLQGKWLRFVIEDLTHDPKKCITVITLEHAR